MGKAQDPATTDSLAEGLWIAEQQFQYLAIIILETVL